ncbi:hypothetical protein Vqi01_54220 [Micromonospora qiuiae]|uniref:Uncharacterized protein n=1 Tax=Micromonospora qiuiae TaxID=502268 RepID=A0ABQ4JIS2_9ACTN|nr:hypothetical protein Vqi01_54220 [Micromonospora qiuiae]
MRNELRCDHNAPTPEVTAVSCLRNGRQVNSARHPASRKARIDHATCGAAQASRAGRTGKHLRVRGMAFLLWTEGGVAIRF